MSQLHKRELVTSLLKAQRLSAREISKNVSVSLATVYNVKTRLARGSKLAHSKGAGRPKTLRNVIKPTLTHQVRCKPYLSLRTLANRSPFKPSHETVRRALKDLTYNKRYPVQTPMLSEKNRLYRIKWARKYKYPKNEWARTIFLDESLIKNDSPQPQSMYLKSTFGPPSPQWEYFHCVFSGKT